MICTQYSLVRSRPQITDHICAELQIITTYQTNRLKFQIITVVKCIICFTIFYHLLPFSHFFTICYNNFFVILFYHFLPFLTLFTIFYHFQPFWPLLTILAFFVVVIFDNSWPLLAMFDHFWQRLTTMSYWRHLNGV